MLSLSMSPSSNVDLDLFLEPYEHYYSSLKNLEVMDVLPI